MLEDSERNENIDNRKWLIHGMDVDQQSNGGDEEGYQHKQATS